MILKVEGLIVTFKCCSQLASGSNDNIHNMPAVCGKQHVKLNAISHASCFKASQPLTTQFKHLLCATPLLPCSPCLERDARIAFRSCLAVAGCCVKQNKWVKGFLLAVCWQLTGYAPLAHNKLIVHGLVGKSFCATASPLTPQSNNP